MSRGWGEADDVDGPSGPIQGLAGTVDSRPRAGGYATCARLSGLGWISPSGGFRFHAVDGDDCEVLNRKLPRDKVLGFLAAIPPCDVALEACSSSHYWGREIGRLGHRVNLISPNYVKPYLKRGKSDAHDARAICEAASRPDMRFVRVKSEEQQAALMQHTSRQLLIDQRTAVANSLRGQLAEFGVIERKGIENVGELVRMLDEDDEELAQIPAGALMVMKILADQLRAVDAHVSAIDEQIEAWQRESAAAQALKTIPGIGALNSAALAAHVPDPSIFRSGRSLRGSVWFRDRTPAAERKGSAG